MIVITSLGMFLQYCEGYNQYIGGYVLLRMFSAVEGVQYCGGILRVLWGDTISTVEVAKQCEGYHQFCRGIQSVLWVETISAVEDIHYC